MNAYDDFCEFAWTQLEDAFGITEKQGIPDHSPYFEFIIGCAAHSLRFGKENSRAFTLEHVLGTDVPNGFARRFIKEFTR